MKKDIVLFIILILTGTLNSLYAQDESWERTEEGEIEDASFIVEKEREIELPVAARKFEKVPPLPDVQASREVAEYSYKTIAPEFIPVEVNNRALKLKSEPLEKLYGGNFKAGFGNYITPLLGLNLYNKREEKYLIGLGAHHLSSRNGPVDMENSGNGSSQIEGNAKFFGSVMNSDISAGYKRSFYHFYGYPEGLDVDSDSIRRTFNHFNVEGSVCNNNLNSDFDYSVGLKYDFISDNFSTSESVFSMDLTTDMFLREDLSFLLDGNLFLSSYKYQESINRNIVSISPKVFYRYGEFDVTAGLNFVFQNDTLTSRSDVLLYPMVRVDYLLNNFLKMYLQLDGDLEAVSFRELSTENPYISPGIPLFHSNRKFGLQWGLNGNIMNHVNIAAGVSLDQYKDYFYYINESSDIARFNVEYDSEGSSVMNLYTELIYSKLKNIHFSVRGDYFNYSNEIIPEAWHRPTYKIQADLEYNVFDKMVFSVQTNFLGGIEYYDFNSDRAETLDPVTDINFEIKYRFSDRLGVFIDFNNILGNNYERYWRYPSRGILVIGGLSFNF